ncbi:MAG: lytic murein transglycosylase [Alphaproteobacteria bacterium]
MNLFAIIKNSIVVIFLSCYFFAGKAFAVEGFDAWLADFKNEALAAGISYDTVDNVLSKVVFEESIIAKDRKQPEFIRTFKNYMDIALAKDRVEQGKTIMKKYRTLLNNVYKLYGIPPQYIVAFWGMETFYGKNLGDISIFNALATLAYDPRRSDFFKKELIYALKIVDSGFMKAEQMKGSWAGAFGNFQFMPSTYLNYAVDADNDGKKDIINSLPDAFYSAGNYLSSIGWNKKQAWGRQVKLPKNFDYFLTGNKIRKKINDWGNLGIKNINNSKLPTSDIETWLLVPAGYQGPVFFVYENFDIIMQWNRSFNYALAIGLLADNLSGRKSMLNQALKEKPISVQIIIAIQDKLKELGLYDGSVDGNLGSITKSAIQNFQKNFKLPADGYPSDKVIKLLTVDSLAQNDIKKIPIPPVKPKIENTRSIPLPQKKPQYIEE